MSEYDDIIRLPHYHDPKRPYMSAHDRAGQFAPFKSLDGYHAEIGDAEREAMRDVWEDINYIQEDYG
ncbi:hypothetical protein IKG06_01420 [Candidatus Saccharibacteria bacterium]|nr:hypothetical protein [Candidatus Saccharibacteria bacterium]